MNFLLLTTANQTPILVGDAGVTIEPETSTNRSIVILPNNNREKHKIVVQEPFWDIVLAVDAIRPYPEPEDVIAAAEEMVAAVAPEKSIGELLSMPDADDIEFEPKPAPEEKKRKPRAKKEVA